MICLPTSISDTIREGQQLAMIGYRYTREMKTVDWNNRHKEQIWFRWCKENRNDLLINNNKYVITIIYI